MIGLRAIALVMAALLAAAPQAAEFVTGEDVPVMVEEAQTAGIEHKYTGPWEYFVGGGIAAFDCNGDRRPDLAVAGGAGAARFYVNHSSAGGRLRFSEKSEWLPPHLLTGVTGFYALDIDNDGRRDLVVLRVGQNAILKGGPDCTFTDATRLFAFDGGRAWTTAFSATFEKSNRFPTMAFGNYVDRAAPGTPWGTCHDNVLMRPEAGDRPDYSDPRPLAPGYCALSMLFTDWNRSGSPSLRITNDRQYHRGGEEQLWRIEPDRAPRPYRASDGWRHLVIWGMGIAEADLDGDGFPEYALTSMGDTKIQKLDDEFDDIRPSYRDIAFELGATAHRPYVGGDFRPSTGWHVEFADFNNDARTDLFIAKGNVERMEDFAAYDPDNLLLGKAPDGFGEFGDRAGIALDRSGRGAIIADLNMDGMLDLAVVNRNAPLSLFRNAGTGTSDRPRPMGNWLAVEVRQSDINRDAIGATISVKTGNLTQTRIVGVGGGHASGHLGFKHFGLGAAERAEIRIKWPDGEWSAPYRVFSGSFAIIDRGAQSVSLWYPPED